MRRTRLGPIARILRHIVLMIIAAVIHIIAVHVY